MKTLKNGNDRSSKNLDSMFSFQTNVVGRYLEITYLLLYVLLNYIICYRQK